MGKKGDLVTNGRMEEKMEVDATPAERQAAEETVPAEPEEASAGGDRQVEQVSALRSGDSHPMKC
jgi:hypothetical protein